MPRLLRYNFAPTLNGFIASLPSHSTPWIVDDPTIDFASLYVEFDTFLMGRKTYETFLALSPTAADNPLAGRPKESVVVFSRDAGFEAKHGRDVTVVSDGVVEFVRRLKMRGQGAEGKSLKGIWLMGGGELAGLLMRAGLLDVIEAAIMPAVVGRGVKVFGDGLERQEGDKGEAGWKLALEKAEALESGILMTRYRVVYDD